VNLHERLREVYPDKYDTRKLKVDIPVPSIPDDEGDEEDFFGASR
jgi:hypothetical protein